MITDAASEIMVRRDMTDLLFRHDLSVCIPPVACFIDLEQGSPIFRKRKAAEATHLESHSTSLQLSRTAIPSVETGATMMLNDREKILSALREKPLKIFEVMKRANMANEEACQSLLMKMRTEGLVKFDIHKGRWLIG
jgi:hypothetical protein